MAEKRPPRAEISRGHHGPLEAIRYARNMPYWEQPPGFGRIGNELLGALPIPLPEDIAALGPIARTLMGTAVNDPTAISEARAMPGALARAAGEHPISTLAATMGPGAAVQAYRDLTPLPVRAFGHAFYGRGRALTYLRPKDAELLQRAFPIGEQDPEMSQVIPRSPADANNVARQLEARGIDVPEDYQYVDPAPRYDKANWTAMQSVGGAFVPSSEGPGARTLYDVWQYHPSQAGGYAHDTLPMLLKRVRQSMAVGRSDPLGVGSPIEALLGRIALKYQQPYPMVLPVWER